jgi:dihydrofolate reductase
VRKLIVFNHISLDGYFVDANGGMSWAKTDAGDAEWKAFVAGNTQGNGPLLFGRVTYDLMASYWPTPMADQHDPVVAERMNNAPKIVFSRTMQKASWQNTALMMGDLATEVQKLKNETGEGMAILGSGSIVAQLAQARLIDEYQIVVDPIVLGKGRTMFEGVKEQLKLKLTKRRAFSNGNVFLSYEPAA